jgi:hypothetical protein
MDSAAMNGTAECVDVFLFFPCDWSKLAAIACFVGIICALLVLVLMGLVVLVCWRLARARRHSPQRIYASSVPTISVIGDLCAAETPQQYTRYSTAATLPRNDSDWKKPTAPEHNSALSPVEHSPFSQYWRTADDNDRSPVVRSNPGDVTFRDNMNLSTFAAAPRYSNLSQIPVDQAFTVSR